MQLERSLRQVPGIAAAEVSFGKSEAAVQFASSTQIDEGVIERTVREAGHRIPPSKSSIEKPADPDR